MLTHLLDTCVYSQRLRPEPLPTVVQRWQKLGDHALAVSSICEAELRYGLEKRDSPRLWQEYHAFLENRLALLSIDQAVSHRFARIKAEQERKGQPRPDFDLWISATALTHDLTIATLNTRHFIGIEGLHVEDWSILY